MAECECGCCKELAAMLAHPATDFDYKRACQCALYPEDEQCDCHFCACRLNDNPRRKEMSQQYECVPSTRDGGWAVEAIKDGGEVSRVLFTGCDDEALAREYAEWKNATRETPDQMAARLYAEIKG